MDISQLLQDSNPKPIPKMNKDTIDKDALTSKPTSTLPSTKDKLSTAKPTTSVSAFNSHIKSSIVPKSSQEMTKTWGNSSKHNSKTNESVSLEESLVEEIHIPENSGFFLSFIFFLHVLDLNLYLTSYDV